MTEKIQQLAAQVPGLADTLEERFKKKTLSISNKTQKFLPLDTSLLI